MQTYFDPAREHDPHALPDCEVFYLTENECQRAGFWNDDEDLPEPGWYWWACFPGCLPDSDPVGPFASEAEALADAREGVS